MTSETTADIDCKKKKRLQHVIKQYQSTLGWMMVVGLGISYSGYIIPKNAYIRCNDAAISHEKNRDTITISLLMVVSLFVPFITMTLVEWINYHQSDLKPFKKGIRKAFGYFLSLLVGGLFAFFIVEVLKTSVSEPRPHFMKTCSPKSCSSNLSTEQSNQPWIHVTYLDCLNPNNVSKLHLMDSMKSFPSGHACLGIFATVFMTAYIKLRVNVQWSKLLVAWLQLMWWTWAILCCTSRIWDRRHHWWDVLAGGIIGGIVAYATVVYLCNWFESGRLNRSRNGDSPIQLPLISEPNGNCGRQNSNEEETIDDCPTNNGNHIH